MSLNEGFDFQNPDYAQIFKARGAKLARLRKQPELLPGLKAFYKEHPAQFINDWGVTVDPRLVERGLPAVVPFLLFPKQEEWIAWVIEHWKTQKPFLTEKTRDMGMSWLAMATACTLCLHYDGMAIGFGSRKEEYVDKIAAPKSLFHKARGFMANLPRELRGGYDPKLHAPHLRISFPATKSNISGEAGDNIGRGDRTGIYFVDEAAYLEHPELIEASLSQTTNCRLDISSPNGMANSFAQKRFSGKYPIFTFHWRDDPRKDDDWYQDQVKKLDAITVAQELDIDYSASVDGVLIPSSWARAAIDAHVKLGLHPTGAYHGAMDIADGGRDLNAFCGAYGFLVNVIEQWSGKDGDIYASMVRAFELCDRNNYKSFRYDADGVGAGAKGMARVINETRARQGLPTLLVEPFRGSSGVMNPLREDVKGRRNEDFFANLKAQAWWALRSRFEKTFRWVTEGKAVTPDEIISLDSKMPLLHKLITELSQPTYTVNTIGKVVVDKTPEGAKSPDLGDAVMMRFGHAARAPLKISAKARHHASHPTLRQRRVA